jgi:tetratricopeptide (TPR) repeat protein
MNKAKNFIPEKSKLQEMIEYYSGVIELLPDEPNGFFNRGFNYFLLQNFQRAFDDFTKVVEMESDNVTALCLRGFAADRIEEHQTAMEDFTRALEADPYFADAYTGMGLIKLRKGSLSEAVNYFDRAVDLEPDNEKGYLYRAEAYYRQKNPDKAMADFEKAMELKPELSDEINRKLANCRLQRGIELVETADFENAVPLLDNAISVYPGNAEAFLYRGEAWMNMEKFDLAAKDFTKAKELDPSGQTGKTAVELLDMIEDLL